MDTKPTREPVDAWRMTDSLHAEHGKGDPFAAAIRATRMPMLITDPRQFDNPIVFANDAFLRLTGYAREEVLGRNCRFLQGPETDSLAIDKIRDAVATRSDIAIDILNYKRDGSPFWNALFVSPVSNEDGDLQFFFASQLDVTDRKESEHALVADKDRFERAVRERTAELQAALDAQKMLVHEVDHRVKNNLQMISSLIVMQSRSIPDENIRKSLSNMLERIEAVSTVHRRLYQSDDVRSFDLAEFARDLVTDLVDASGRGDIRTEFDLEKIAIPAQWATPVALMVNELVTNAIKHAFDGRRNGAEHLIRTAIEHRGDRYTIEISDNGRGITALGGGTFGTRLVRSLTRQLDATIEWRDGAPGTRVVVSIPAPKE
ncbi:histidine kinase dimerization/phosphoacceptor domain -containing protein [Mesorhizobium australicum]|uniref:PAS domain S-box-containing protein n=1 Tax=Mesorhizobium australicum TaxID=536018 RepID=A0A1X7P6Z2_9HYPH|nr:histidine kinase dimerization/phosphoacceptor domain -containing protein [Mesorhizobium australicum]SMH46085.1 PAS domain S-box-containing protein [Mesorhizobium australicum]